MKRKGELQKHPGQENKSGKAIYASTTSINSSTVPPTRVANFESGEANAGLTRNSSRASERNHRFSKTSKHSK